MEKIGRLGRKQSMVRSRSTVWLICFTSTALRGLAKESRAASDVFPHLFVFVASANFVWCILKSQNRQKEASRASELAPGGF